MGLGDGQADRFVYRMKDGDKSRLGFCNIWISEGLMNNQEGGEDHVGMTPIFISGRSYQKRAAKRRCMSLRNEEMLHEGVGGLG